MMTSEQGPETCNTYNMLRLTKMLYQTSGDMAYMDYYERALYNHILSSQNRAGRIGVFHSHAFRALQGIFTASKLFLVLCGIGNGEPCKVRGDDICIT